MLDDMLDYVAHIRERPVWAPMPQEVRDHFRAGIPAEPTPLQEVHREFMEYVLPYAGGNVHPGFMGWVQGGGTVTGMLAEMLAGGLNANLADAIMPFVEGNAVGVRQLFGFPEKPAAFRDGYLHGQSACVAGRAYVRSAKPAANGIGRRGPTGLCLPVSMVASPTRWTWRVWIGALPLVPVNRIAYGCRGAARNDCA
jgi:hypothetical protein